MDLKSFRRPQQDGAGLLHRITFGRWVQLAVVLVVLGLMSGAVLVGANLNARGQLTSERIRSALRNSNPAALITGKNHPQLETLDLRIGFAELEKLEEKRAEGREIRISNYGDEDLVSADIAVGDVITPVKIRGKGDWAKQANEEKPSFRIEVENGHAIASMTRFSLHDPRARTLLYEWGYLAHLRASGILAPRYDFVNVEINGDSFGIYSIEEHFDSTLIENQNKRAGVILKWEEDPLWVWRAESFRYQTDGIEKFTLQIVDYGTALPAVFQPSKIRNSPDLQMQADAGMALLRGWQSGDLTASEVFDIEKMGLYAAISDLWAVAHGHFWHNRRFYYNPITALLEPVGFDAEAFNEGYSLTNNEGYTVTDNSHPSLTRLQIREDRELAASYVVGLTQVSSTESIDQIRELLADDADALFRILSSEFEQAVDPMESLILRATSIRNALRPEFPLMTTRYEQDGSTFVVVFNLIELPVEIVGFVIGEGDRLSAAPLLTSPESDAIFSSSDSEDIVGNTNGVLLRPNVEKSVACKSTGLCVTFQLPDGTRPSPLGRDVQVISSIIGSEIWDWSLAQSIPNPATGAVVKIPETIGSVLAKHPYLELSENGTDVQFKRGNWIVDSDVILPIGIGLSINDGTEIRFARGVTVAISGPLQIVGTPGSLVKLGSVDGSWSGILVSKSVRHSTIQNAVITDTAGINRGGWQTTGGVTFYESDVEIRASIFADSEAEDALNVINSTVLIAESEFRSVVSDAFDGDFVSATIVSTIFEEIGGDAVDVAGSIVNISDSSFRNIGDKALSVGEQSVLNGHDLIMTDVGIGVASKDSSMTKLYSVTIVGANVAALAAYQKKPVFGPGSLEVTELTVDSASRVTMTDLNSSITIDAKRYVGSELDLEALFNAGILGN